VRVMMMAVMAMSQHRYSYKVTDLRWTVKGDLQTSPSIISIHCIGILHEGVTIGS
jgi:hypothetical protein